MSNPRLRASYKLKDCWLLVLFTLISNTGYSNLLDGPGNLPDIYIFSIGIDSYSELGDLKFCKADVARFNKYISTIPEKSVKYLHPNTAKYSSEVINYGRIIQVSLLDFDATWVNVDSVFKHVARIIKPKDYFFFYYAGMSNPVGDSHHFLFSNSPIRSSKDHEMNYFDLNDLKTWLDVIPAKNQMVIMDACGDDFEFKLQKAVFGQDPIEAILSDRNRVIVSVNGLAYEDPKNGGVLNYLITKLTTGNLLDCFYEERRKKVEWEIMKLQKENGWDAKGANGDFYISIFYEKELLKYLNLTKDKFIPATTRGGTVEYEGKRISGINKYEVQNIALIIGIDEYDSPNWPQLSNPVNDARKIEQELKSRFGFATELLTNPTKQEIMLALYRYHQLNYDSIKSQLLIFFAGHGGYDDLVSGYLVTKDSRSGAEDPTRESYITHSKLRDMINNIKCPHILVVLDACFGGTFDQRISIASHRNENDPLYKPVLNDDFIRRKLGYKSRFYMTSGGKEYVPDGRPGMHSPFTRQFLEILRSSEGTKIITTADFKASLQRLQPEPRFGEFGNNEPGGDFLLMVRE